jgi:DNA-binding response OmpR family regulator
MMRVLIIEDEDDIREVAQASLEIMAGLDVITASTSQEGLSKATSERPDVILLDVMLPDMDGLALFQQLQASSTTRNIPVILLTAKVHEMDKRRFAESGVKAMIAKPFKPTELASQLLQILQTQN